MTSATKEFRMQVERTPSRRRHSETGATNSHRSGTVLEVSRNAEESGIFGRIFWCTRWIRRLIFSPTKRRVAFCIVTLFLLIFSPFLLYHFLNTEMGRQNNAITSTNSFSSFIQPAPSEDIHDRPRTKPDQDNNGDSFFSAFEPEKHVLDSMNQRLGELDRVRVSLLNELRNLEKKRNDLRSEIEALAVQSERQQAELRKGYKDLEQVKLQIEQANLIRKEMAERNTPEIALPKPLRPRPFSALGGGTAAKESSFCSMATCFDYSRCSITAGFPVFIYGVDAVSSSEIFDPALIRIFAKSVYAVRDPSLACVFVAILKEGTVLESDTIKKYLPYWQRTGDGANHLIFNAAPASTLGRSLVVNDQYRSRLGFDILAPSFTANLPDVDDEKSLLDSPFLVPARRHYLLSVMHCPIFQNGTGGPEHGFLISEFQRMGSTKTEDLFYFHPSCQSISSSSGTQELEVKKVLEQSTFTLLIFTEYDGQSNFVLRFLNCLKAGAVPVVMTSSSLPFSHFLPFGETLNWRLATVQLPLSRLPELHFYLRTLTDADIVKLRGHGKLFYQTYFATKTKLAETILATMRQRLNIPAAPIEEAGSISFYNETYEPIFGDVTTKASELQTFNDDEYLGPVEMPYPSPKYQQNFTLVSTYSYELWNVYADPFRMYPQFPFTKVTLPSEAKFLGECNLIWIMKD